MKIERKMNEKELAEIIEKYRKSQDRPSEKISLGKLFEEYKEAIKDKPIEELISFSPRFCQHDEYIPYLKK